jgi:hypothetical protein
MVVATLVRDASEKQKVLRDYQIGKDLVHQNILRTLAWLVRLMFSFSTCDHTTAFARPTMMLYCCESFATQGISALSLSLPTTNRKLRLPSR